MKNNEKNILNMVMTLVLSTTEVYADTKSQTTARLVGGGVGIESLQFIQDGYTKLIDNGNGSITIYGELTNSSTCDILGMNFSIQYYDGSSWVTLRTINKEAYNTRLYTTTVPSTVTPGFEYRIRTQYYSQVGTTFENS